MKKRILPAIAAIIAIVVLAFAVIFSDGDDTTPAPSPSEEPVSEAEPQEQDDDNPHLDACAEDPESCYERAIQMSDELDMEDSNIAEVAAIFEAVCAHGIGVACQDRAVMAQEGIGQQEDITEALIFYEKGCDLDHEPACAMGRVLTSNSPDRSPELWIERCDDGELSDCVQLGIHVESGGELEDGRTALELFEHACTEGGGEECFWLARHLDSIDSGASDEELEELYQKACDDDMARSCSTLARRIDARDGDNAQLIETLQRACDLQDGHGCFHLGLVHMRDEETEPATEAWRKGCDLWHGDACQHLGQVLLSEPDEESAPFFERGCQMGIPAACFNFAVHLNTEVSPPPFEQSRRHLEQACRNDHLVACAFLAGMLRNGQGGPAEPDRAAEISRRACEGGIQMACPNAPKEGMSPDR